MLINSFATMPTTLLVSGFDIRHNEICTTEIPLELPACINTIRMKLTTVTGTNDLLIAPNLAAQSVPMKSSANVSRLCGIF